MPRKSQDIELDRLCAAIRSARKSLQKFREDRREIVRQWVGTHYGEQGAALPVPINMIGQFLEIMIRSVVSQTPRAMITTELPEVGPYANAMQAWANEEFVNMGFAETLERAAFDGFLSVGIVKVDLLSPAYAALQGWESAAGTPYADVVDLDDFAYDIHARDFREAAWVANRVRVPIDAVKGSPLYSKRARKLEPAEDNPYNHDGDERVGVISRSSSTYTDEEFEDYVNLWEVYLPRRRTVVTIADDDIDGPGSDGAKYEPLREADWLGPDCGPYHYLRLGMVPDNAMPRSPVMGLIDLHKVINQLARKLFDQALRQKETFPVPPNSAKDGNVLIDAPDGFVWQCDQPDKVKALLTGGPNQANFQLSDYLQKKFSEYGGNLQLLSGAGPQSRTAAQDKMLNENAGATVANYQSRMMKFTGEVQKAICWFWHYDPQKAMETTYRLPGRPSLAVNRSIGPDQRQVPFEKLKIRIDPYSLNAQSPQQRAQFLTQMLMQMQPFMPFMQQQGMGLNMEFFIKKMSELGDMPDLKELFMVQSIATPGGSGTGDEQAAGKPAETTRNYTRTSLGSESSQAQDAEMTNALAADDPNWNGPMSG